MQEKWALYVSMTDFWHEGGCGHKVIMMRDDECRRDCGKISFHSLFWWKRMVVCWVV